MQLRDLILEKRQSLRAMINSGEHPDIAAIKLNICTRYDAFVLLNRAGVRPRHIFEAGTSSPAVTASRNEILNQIQELTILELLQYDDGDIPRKFSLLDVRQEVVKALYDVWGKYEWINIFGCAVGDGKPANVSLAGHSTFVGDIKSPYVVNNVDDKIMHEQKIETVKFNELDDGTIDVLLADLEGNEWFVLKNMVSRPFIIQLETHSLNPAEPEKEYINPFIDEIVGWMKKNDYVFHATTSGDTIFVSEKFAQFLNEKKYVIQ